MYKHQKYTSIAVLTVVIVAFVSFAYLRGNIPGMASDNYIGKASSEDITLAIKNISVFPKNEKSHLQRIAVVVSAKNFSKEVLQISPGLQMFLVDASGKLSPMTAQYLPQSQIVGGPVSTGNTWTQSIDFDIPAGSNPKEFIFQKDGSSDPLKIDL